MPFTQEQKEKLANLILATQTSSEISVFDIDGEMDDDDDFYPLLKELCDNLGYTIGDEPMESMPPIYDIHKN